MPSPLSFCFALNFLFHLPNFQALNKQVEKEEEKMMPEGTKVCEGQAGSQ